MNIPKDRTRKRKGTWVDDLLTAFIFIAFILLALEIGGM